jgi:two-component system response regulator YesN
MKKFNDKFLVKLSLSYSIILIFILIMGLYMYYVGIESARENLVQSNYSTLKNSVADVDKSLQIISSLSSQITRDSNLQNIMRTEEVINSSFFVDVIEARTYLANLLPMQNITFVENVFLYLYNTDYILSSNLLESSSLYYHYARRYDKKHYEDYMKRLTNPHLSGVLQTLDIFAVKNPGELLLYVLPASMYHLGSPIPASICYEINLADFETIFAGLNLYETGSIYIKDRDGNEIIKITTPSSLSINSKELNEHINTTNQTKPKTVKVGNEKMIITSITSNNNQWTYYLIQPSGMAFKELESSQRTYALIISMTILTGALFIIVLSKRSLKPFFVIESRLKSSLSEEDLSIASSKNDLVYSLDNYVERLIKRKESLQETLEHQRPIIYSSYLARLMNEIIYDSQEINLISNYLNLNNKNYSGYVILYINVYLDSLDFYIDDYTNGNQNSYKDFVKEVLYTHFGSNILIYEADHHSFGVLLATNESNDVLEYYKDKFMEIHNELKRNYSFVIFGGISKIYTDLTFTWQAYQQATDAISYTGPDNVFQHYNSIKKMNDSYHYPTELSQQLISSIHGGKEKQVEELLKYIYTENFIERSLSITMIKWLLSDLRNTLLKTRFMIATDSKNDELAKIDDMFQGKKSFVLIEDLALHLCRVFEPRTTSNTLIANIKQYIKENYKDSSLSLSKISVIFNISESYFSHLFKEETKENFSEYLEKLRIDLAMKLLKSTDMNISDISLEVGYNSPLSFRRAFKKIHGTTPMATRTVAKDIYGSHIVDEN